MWVAEYSGWLLGCSYVLCCSGWLLGFYVGSRVFWVVARVFLCVMMFWVVARVFMWVAEYSGWLQGCYYVL